MLSEEAFKETSTMSQPLRDFTPPPIVSVLQMNTCQLPNLFLVQSHTAGKLEGMNGAPMHFGGMASPLQLHVLRATYPSF